MVFAIARNKAVDFLRTRKKHRVNVDYDAILDAVAADTKDTDLGFRWRLKIGSGEAKEVREILLKFIPTLPERQRIVAQCFVDNFELFRPRAIYKPLAEAVSAVTGITEMRGRREERLALRPREDHRPLTRTRLRLFRVE